MMSRVQKGMIAGLAATIAVSALEAANLYFGPWAASFPRLLSVMLQMPDVMAAGWVAHFLVGAAKSLVTTRSWWRSGLEMTVVAILVAGVAYLLGSLLNIGV